MGQSARMRPGGVAGPWGGLLLGGLALESIRSLFLGLFVSTRSRIGISSHDRALRSIPGLSLSFSNLRAEEHRLKQACLLLMRRTCNL